MKEVKRGEWYMSEREAEHTVELNIGTLHCTITFLKEDNTNWKDEVIRILEKNHYINNVAKQ